jgi:hypothetical protein
MAARGRGRGVPICHEQQEKIMNSLEAAKYEVCILFSERQLIADLYPSHVFFNLIADTSRMHSSTNT